MDKSNTSNIFKKYEKTISYLAMRITSDKELQNDLKQEGSIGLLYAIDAYNPDLSNNKSQHSFFCDNIRFYMMDYLTKYSRVVKIPNYLLKKDKELMFLKQKVSIDRVYSDNEDGYEYDNNILDIFLLYEEEDGIDEDKLRVIIQEIYKLTPYQQQLFKLHFFDGYSKTDLSKMIIDGKKVTRQNIGQHINTSLDKIKNNIIK